MDEARNGGAQALAAEEAMQPATFEEQVRRGCDLLQQNPAKRPLLYKTLARIAQGPVDLAVLEDELARDVRCAKGSMAPYFYAQWLADAGMARRLDTDGSGRPVNRDDYPELDDDAFDDMLAGFAYEITGAGREVLVRFSPDSRLRALYESQPQRVAVYEDLLAFLREKHHLGQIDSYVRGLASYQAYVAEHQELSPSVFVDKLSDAGVIAFDGGWVVQEGKGEQTLS